jgi:hypothetical protein
MTTLKCLSLSTILLFTMQDVTFSVLSLGDKIMTTLTLVLISLLLCTVRDVTYSVLRSLDEEKGRGRKSTNGDL